MKPILPKVTSTAKSLEEAKTIPRIIAPPGITILLIPSDFGKSNLIISNVRIDSSTPSAVSKNNNEPAEVKDKLEVNSSSLVEALNTSSSTTVSKFSKNVNKKVEKKRQFNHKRDINSPRLPFTAKDNKIIPNKEDIVLQNNNNSRCTVDQRTLIDENSGCKFQKKNSSERNKKHQEDELYENISNVFGNDIVNTENCVSVSTENIKVDMCVSSPPSYESHVSNSSKVLIQIEENGKITNEFLSDIPVPPSYSQTPQRNNESLYTSPNTLSSNKLNEDSNLVYHDSSYQYSLNHLDSNYSNEESTDNLNTVSYQTTSSIKSFETESNLPANILNYNYNCVKDAKLHGASTYDEASWCYSNNDDQPRDYSCNSVLNSSQKLETEKIDSIDSFMENALNQVLFSQENESSYEERKNFAKNILSVPGNEIDRKKALQENFWIVEDEPLIESIFIKPVEAKDDIPCAVKLKSLKSKPSKNYICHICGKTLKGRSSLRPHINLHMNIKPYECTYCFKKFTQSSVMKNHLRIHTGETPYSCLTCGKAFKTLSILRRHSYQHSQLRPFDCCVCTKAFKSKVDLQCHLKVHTSGPHVCTFCKTLFDTRKSLTTHVQRKHKSEKKHLCTICNQAYSSKMLLQQHMNIHSNKPKHSCHVCDASYTWRSGLASHMRTHSFKIQCEICGKKFTSLKKHEKHRSRHSEPSPHKCTKCGKQFKYSSLLKKHFAKHKDELFCQECGIGFIYKTHMKKHLKTHSHKEN